jgi:arabinan endo-1,5-alpha-L-arabinosidase
MVRRGTDGGGLHARSGVRLLAALAAAVLLLLAPLGTRAALPQSTGSYANPVIAQNVADPSVIKALDGYYYLAGSSDYWNDGSYHMLPIFRSTDLVHWTFVRDAVSARPAWAADDAGLWAPDIQYFNHRYYMYYMVNWSKPMPAYNSNGGSAIGVLTAPSMEGPWTDSGPPAGGSFTSGPVIPPRQVYAFPCDVSSNPLGCYVWTFDPAEFVDATGQRYLYYGSYFGGTLVQPLAADGLQTAGAATQIGHWDRYEGTYVVRHDVDGQPYYYNFSSAANCCQGPNTAYSVETNRATSPTGTFSDQNGVPMLYPGSTPALTSVGNDPAADNRGDQGGGYPTLKQNGNRWHGTGHNGLITDLSGQQWIVYHGVDRQNGWLTGGPNFPITYRQVLLDRLDWTADGWPVVNAGAGPSESNTAPSTTPVLGDNFNTGSTCAAPDTAGPFAATWQTVRGVWIERASATCPTTTGGYVEDGSANGSALLVSARSVPAGSRTECDLRLATSGSGDYGCVAAYLGDSGRGVAAVIDAAGRTLTVGVLQQNGTLQGAQSTSLPAGFDATDWHHLTLDENSTVPGRPTFAVTLSDRDRDPLATVNVAVPADFANHDGSIGFVTENARADFDNITAAGLQSSTVAAPTAPAAGALLSQYSDEFNGTSLDSSKWSLIRPDPSLYSVANGQLSITVNGDLYQQYNTAKDIVVENQPAGNYMVETKITFDPRDNYQQAGLLIYSDDDHYIKVGPAHSDSLNKMISGKESLEPAPPSDSGCSAGSPLGGSNVAISTYTHAQCPNEGEAWDYLTNPKPTENGGTATDPQVIDYLRIYRSGNVYTPYTSVDGSHWVRGAAWELTAADVGFPIKIGLFAFAAGGGLDIPARFDYVHVYAGS